MTADPKTGDQRLVPSHERRDLIGDPRSFVQLLADASDQFARLLRSEMAVVRAEMAEKVVEAATGVAALIVALVVLLPALVLLLMALASWLVELGLRASLAQLIAAVVGFVLCGALLLFGKSRLSAKALKPRHVAHEMERDAEALRRAV